VSSPPQGKSTVATEEVTIPADVPGRTRRTALVVAAGLACGWWVTSLTPFSAGATVAVLAFGVVELALAEAVRHRRRLTGPGRGADLPITAYLVWVVALAVLAAWELFSLFNHPRSAHPTISSLVDPLLAHHVIRWLAFAAWAWLGWELAR